MNPKTKPNRETGFTILIILFVMALISIAIVGKYLERLHTIDDPIYRHYQREEKFYMPLINDDLSTERFSDSVKKYECLSKEYLK